ncbi:MAG: hypothetical protein V1645_03730 [archaeon]
MAGKNKHKLVKYLILYIATYFIIDFATGFNWDVQYWLSVNGPLMMAILYPLSGLIFYYIIYKRKWEDWKIFTAMMAYAMFIEAFVLRNPFVITFPALMAGIPLAADLYGLIVFLPKWITDKEVRKHKLLLAIMTIIFIILAIIAYFNNPHAV